MTARHESIVAQVNGSSNFFNLGEWKIYLGNLMKKKVILKYPPPPFYVYVKVLSENTFW
jgi:hypothetical protein